ncbi:MAG: VOC family protein [Microbacterium sp.]
MMAVTGFYPVLMTEDVAAAASFYRELVGFETTFESDWYVSLRLGDHELALLAAGHETIPGGFRRPVSGGLLLNLEVDDVDAVHERIVAAQGVTLAQELRDEEFGQRHFIVEAPDDVLLDVIQPIPPSPEFAAAYMGE